MTSSICWIDREGLAEVLAQLGASAGSESTEAVVVRIGVSTRDVGPAFTEGRPWAKEGAFASIRLTNHGPGWWSEREDALWDLFERDRLRGGVRGLALPMAYGFVKQHGGFVLAEPVGDTGARVELFFPLLPGDVRFDRAEHSERVDRSRRGQMVLYCEDNERLRRAGVRILEKAGYRVREAGNGREAVEILEGDDNGVDLVLSDLVMPQMDGAALHRYVSAMVCPPAFLFTTGHADARGAELPQGVPYVLKPWRREEIVAAVGRALSGAETVPVNSSGDGTVDDT